MPSLFDTPPPSPEMGDGEIDLDLERLIDEAILGPGEAKSPKFTFQTPKPRAPGRLLSQDLELDLENFQSNYDLLREHTLPFEPCIAAGFESPEGAALLHTPYQSQRTNYLLGPNFPSTFESTPYAWRTKAIPESLDALCQTPPGMRSLAAPSHSPMQLRSPISHEDSLYGLLSSSPLLAHYQQMQQCAETLTMLKKSAEAENVNPREVEVLRTRFRTQYEQLAEALQVPALAPDNGSELLALLDRYIPRCGDDLTSIGSIPHHFGLPCVGPCRFHGKGKCFDGALCRFCHFRDDHPGAVKKASKKSRKARKLPRGRPMREFMSYRGGMCTTPMDAYARWLHDGCPEFTPPQWPTDELAAY